jgi:Di-N-acetylchitobiase
VFSGLLFADLSLLCPQVKMVTDAGADGLNVDVESPITSPEQPALLTQLVSNVTRALHAANPVSQVSFDVAWSPNDIDGRSYDYVGLSEACDVLFVMAYDERSQVWSGPCIASANAGLSQTTAGLDAYLALNIPKSKLILGTPWYGRLYPCLSLVDDVCSIQYVPFRGCNCSDAVSSEIVYSSITPPPGGPQWSNVTASPYYNIGSSQQMWYDNPESLTLKYGLAGNRGVKGVGMWTADFSTDVDMWAALDAFFTRVLAHTQGVARKLMVEN